MTGPMAGRLLGRRHLLRIGRLGLPGYTALLYVGCVTGVLAGAAVAQSEGLAAQSFALAAIALLIPALIGARLWFVVQHLETFRGDPRRLWRRRDGGSTLYGGLLVAVVCSVPVLAVAGISFARFWDAAAITMLVGLILGRLGCLLNGCCAGRVTSRRYGLRLPDLDGRWRRRYPTQLLEAGWGALVLAGALVLGPGARPGLVFAGVVTAYAAGRAVLEPTRESARPERERWVNMAFSACLLAAGAAVLAAAWLT